MRILALIAAVLVVFSSPAFGQKKPAPAAVKIAPSSGKAMCSVLSLDDLTKAGVAVTSVAAQSSDDSTNAYCGFYAKSGDVEFDIFNPAGDTPVAVIGTERTIYGEAGGRFTPVSIPDVQGVQSAQICLAVPGKKPAAGIVVRKNLAVFALYIPAGPRAREQLLALAKTVIGRLQN